MTMCGLNWYSYVRNLPMYLLCSIVYSLLAVIVCYCLLVYMLAKQKSSFVPNVHITWFFTSFLELQLAHFDHSQLYVCIYLAHWDHLQSYALKLRGQGAVAPTEFIMYILAPPLFTSQLYRKHEEQCCLE